MEYQRLGFKDINEAMRGVDAQVSVAKSYLNSLIYKQIKARYKEELVKLNSNNENKFNFNNLEK